MSHQEETWHSIIDYAQERDISISTIRRHIKSGRLKYKMKNGKYFILYKKSSINRLTKKAPQDFKDEVRLLILKNKKLEEEVGELKMLVTLYEQEKLKRSLPELPVVN